MSKKRGAGEGTIFQLPDGRWCGLVNLGFRNGKRWRKKYTAPTEKEVQKRVREARTSLANGFILDTEHLRVGDFLKRWLNDTVRTSVRPRTSDSYSDLVNRYLVPRIGRIELAKLSPQHVRQCLNELLENGGVPTTDKEGNVHKNGLSPRTVQYCRAVLRRALGEAVKDGLAVRNVAALADGPKAEHHEIQPYTPEQARTLLKAVEGNRLEALFTVAVALGLRQGEILGLRWQDIDFEAGTLTVSNQLQRIDGKVTLVPPKTKRSRRTIVLPGVCVNALRKHRETQSRDKELAGDRWKDSEMLFTSTIGTPLEACNLNHRFQAISSAAGLPKIRFHDLRHTAATLLMAQGVHARLVMEILGHSSISVTLNTYSHVTQTMQAEVASKMDGILSGDSSNQATRKLVATSMATSDSKPLTH